MNTDYISYEDVEEYEMKKNFRRQVNKLFCFNHHLILYC